MNKLVRESKDELHEGLLESDRYQGATLIPETSTESTHAYHVQIAGEDRSIELVYNQRDNTVGLVYGEEEDLERLGQSLDAEIESRKGKSVLRL